MNLAENQVPKGIRDIVDAELKTFDDAVSITNYTNLPETSQIPIENPSHWFRVDEVTCVFIDMIGSTKLSASTRPKTMAKIYRLFTQTIVKIFHEFDAPYIDIKGDGVFALFNPDQVYRALAAAITAKTFIDFEFCKKIENIANEDEKQIGAHIGIDRNTLLVRKMGLKMVAARTDRQNEVWAGKAVNMAAKLGSLTNKGEMLASERFFRTVPDSLVRQSCDCSDKVDLWNEVLLDDLRFDFQKAYKLTSSWCPIHGKEYCNAIVALGN